MSAVASIQPVPEEVPKSADERERDVVIADIEGDGKTIQATTSFTVTWNDRESGKTKTGTFTAQRPALGTLGKIAVLKAKLNGGEKVDADADFLHEMMSALQYILTDFPDWWKPTEFFTVDPLREVWEYVRRWIDNFRKQRVG